MKKKTAFLPFALSRALSLPPVRPSAIPLCGTARRRLFSPDTAPTLPRGNYGAEDARYALVVEGLSDEETELLLPVRARRYREDELAIAAEACMEKTSARRLKRQCLALGNSNEA